MSADELNEKQKRFVAEYLIDLNATQAATRAGYSARTANEQGARLLAKVSVRTAVEQALKDQQKRTLITADQVLLDIQSMGNDAWEAKEFQAALRSRELIGKRYKLFTDKLEVVDTTPRAERLARARARKADA